MGRVIVKVAMSEQERDEFLNFATAEAVWSGLELPRIKGEGLWLLGRLEGKPVVTGFLVADEAAGEGAYVLVDVVEGFRGAQWALFAYALRFAKEQRARQVTAHFELDALNATPFTRFFEVRAPSNAEPQRRAVVGIGVGPHAFALQIAAARRSSRRAAMMQ